MKISWGWKIVALYSGFVMLMLFMVYMTTTEEFHMVKEDYYGAELQHNDHMQKVRNVQALNEAISLTYQPKAQEIAIQFPADMPQIEGKIQLYRPSNSHLDVSIDLKTDTQNLHRLSTEPYPKGKWILQIDWTSNGKSYYFEKTVII